MNQILKNGQKISTQSSGMECVVKRCIGGGGQGEVYETCLDGQPLALKWYFSQQATAEQKAALELLVNKGTPDSRFLWPLELVADPEVEGFGYLMRLRPKGYKNIVDLMKCRVEPSFRVLATVGLQLAESYKKLHACGLCYRDINFENVFFDPHTGEVLICDNDNVGINGASFTGVLGTPRFMAPEIVRGDAKPNADTDLFSLAVLLFYLFMVNHPLEGLKHEKIKCFDLPAMNLIYGKEPVFIFDPDNDTNRPHPIYHSNALEYWQIYPRFLQNIFIRAFTDGIRDSVNGRVRESEWCNAMVQLRDSILYCGNCGAENFYDSDALASAGKLNNCWHCGKEIHIPFTIQIGRQIVMLNHDTILYPHHLDIDRAYDFSTPAAKVVRHPSNPNLWGLQNLTDKNWTSASTDSAITEISPNRSISLKSGVKVSFSSIEGEIQSAEREA